MTVSTSEDWGKLERVLKFLHDTANDKRIVRVYDISTLPSYIDASYAVNPNIKNHTDGLITFGKGIIHGKSSKQKLSVKSSIDTEIVGVSDYLPYTIR